MIYSRRYERTFIAGQFHVSILQWLFVGCYHIEVSVLFYRRSLDKRECSAAYCTALYGMLSLVVLQIMFVYCIPWHETRAHVFLEEIHCMHMPGTIHFPWYGGDLLVREYVYVVNAPTLLWMCTLSHIQVVASLHNCTRALCKTSDYRRTLLM